MQAHRVHVTLPENHKVMIDGPAEVPTGDAEVIVLSSASVGALPSADTTFAARFRPNPASGPITPSASSRRMQLWIGLRRLSSPRDFEGQRDGCHAGLLERSKVSQETEEPTA